MYKKKLKFKYVIPVTWEVSTVMNIEASSLEEAQRIANDADLPDGDYVDGSWEIHVDILDEYKQNIISQECEKIVTAPLDKLPLMLHDIKYAEAKSLLEERLKEGK